MTGLPGLAKICKVPFACHSIRKNSKFPNNPIRKFPPHGFPNPAVYSKSKAVHYSKHPHPRFHAADTHSDSPGTVFTSYWIRILPKHDRMHKRGRDLVSFFGLPKARKVAGKEDKDGSGNQPAGTKVRAFSIVYFTIICTEC